ncbi:NADH-dependent [FeFe] hydrogenase, group A6 [Clostridium intestinale]|uniref:NADH-dependent [FeFe] hydrogenase, group A6 n=1 Tax=Clostridium intestinale TaxID=36845 RepID=UPI002DD64A68|nr:NADH-dependent [FeFe] hydrogenase, group A6 [Clostridium intestinale]WRY51353.1 NADH-dependent [FeFe] hydrogenase, group A6 [Clostridium intestinale]
MNYCKVIIDKKEVSVPEGTTILQAAKLLNINIPTLCYHPDQSVKANCRICLVEIKERNSLVTACSTPVWEGAQILTSSKRVLDARKSVLELILANHQQDCLKCIRNGSCELQDICRQFNLRDSDLSNIAQRYPLDNTNPSVVRDRSKCIKCNRCVEMCETTQGIGALCHSHRSSNLTVGTAYNETLEKSNCIYCGQCTTVCPVGALYEKDDTEKVWEILNEADKHVIVQVAPSIRVSVGDEFNMPAGENVTGKMVASLRRMGFDKVFDTNFAADLTIMEEGNELVERIEKNGVLPMITSCCPGWINYAEIYSPSILKNLSSCKSPQQMFGAISKSYYSEKFGVSPEDIVTVSIMPCTAKKYEANRSEMKTNGVKEVDFVLTTREFARMINTANIDFRNIKEEEFDSPLGIASGAGALFGATGGVMEAALRTAYTLLTDEKLESIEFKEVRGMKGVKEAVININDVPIKIAVVHGISNVKNIIEQIENGTVEYSFIEVMACVGGCVGGGGQPVGSTLKAKEKRLEQIYRIDERKEIRESHKNPEIIKLYSEYLGKPMSSLSHKLLHTKYSPRNMD